MQDSKTTFAQSFKTDKVSLSGTADKVLKTTY